ncbi:MAG: MarR family transcriptional regulator [Acidobacteriota bacterium]
MTNEPPGERLPSSTLARTLAGPLFLGKRADELSLLIERQVEPIFRRLGLVVPVRSCSLLLELGRREGATAADLSKALGTSHQLVLQKVPALLAAGLIERGRDPDDRRRRAFSLTSRGVEEIERLLASSDEITAIYREIDAEIGVDLFSALGRALAALEAKGLEERLAERADGGERTGTRSSSES